jgi:hypothetical protein
MLLINYRGAVPNADGIAIFFMMLSQLQLLLASLLGLALSHLLAGNIIVRAIASLLVYPSLIVPVLCAGISDGYATLSRLFFTKAIRSGA